ncbi:hypothetical protein AMJ87_13380 [candidate division WOR_3 bacterium SM23_60]|uniref:Apolipoprotein N-acyltransferase n=1 Tax=candidate division WOR_3 bacterium SM23_60 TaxID=1703780 RepID=A0A0S8G3A0_UNCW3|nr:MAG: hypothetical protein AMJ87_13380 [candidate division WOR_3 bacterium SM23_60]
MRARAAPLNQLNKWQRLTLLLTSAVLMSLSFHPIGLYFCAWFGLVPLFFAIDGMSLKSSFVSGIVFGFFFSLFSLFWLVFLQIEINIRMLLLAGLILLFLYFGIYWGVGTLVSHRRLWLFPFAVAGLEFIRGIGEIGFPWLSLGYSQARYPLIIQQTSLYGVYGLSWWLVLANVSLYKVVTQRTLRYIIILLVIIAAPLVYGKIRMQRPQGRTITIGIIQPNIDPNLKFTRGMREKTFERLIALSRECAQTKYLDLIIWPETAIPIFLKTSGRYHDRVLSLVNSINTAVLTGTPVYEHAEDEVYNGAVLIEPHRGITQEYRKVHLVPFGEHIPFGQYIPFLRKIDVGGGDYAPGKKYTIFNAPAIDFSCLICFESIFPELSRRFVNRGAQLLVNITNDGWFGTISGPQQHNDMAIIRAAENAVPLARCSNTGISMVVDRYGRIQQETRLFREAYITSTVVIQSEKTVYQHLGDVVPIVSLLLVAVVVVFRARKHTTRYN